MESANPEFDAIVAGLADDPYAGAMLDKSMAITIASEDFVQEAVSKINHIGREDPAFRQDARDVLAKHIALIYRLDSPELAEDVISTAEAMMEGFRYGEA